MQSHIGCTCTVFLLSGRSNVSLNSLPGKMNSHICCNCRVFLQCGFSNVSTICLHQQIQNHIGCIWTVFLHCVFVNASLNNWHKKMIIHIDCICDICLQSEFSYVSSKFLPVQMQSHIAFAFVCFLVLFFFFIEGRTFQRKKFSCWWQFINCFSLSLTIGHP